MKLLHSSDFLSRCESLSRTSFEPEIKAGTVLARGFADLGYEEFLLLPSQSLLSLYRGELSGSVQLGDPELFVVPTISEMQAAIRSSGYDIQSLDYLDQREWRLKLQHFEDPELQIEVLTTEMEEVFLEALLVIYDEQKESVANV